MDTYYDPKDLDHFPEVGRSRPELWAKFMDYYSAVFADGALTESGVDPVSWTLDPWRRRVPRCIG